MLGALTLVTALFVDIRLLTVYIPWKTLVPLVRTICLVLQLLTILGMFAPGTVVFLWTTWFRWRLCPALIMRLILILVAKFGLSVTASGVTLCAALRPPPVRTVLMSVVGCIRGTSLFPGLITIGILL